HSKSLPDLGRIPGKDTWVVHVALLSRPIARYWPGKRQSLSSPRYFFASIP
ncbi:MAG: hypothetical protein ACI8WM_001235, partial [Burkholderiaceae bacterium]